MFLVESHLIICQVGGFRRLPQTRDANLVVGRMRTSIPTTILKQNNEEERTFINPPPRDRWSHTRGSKVIAHGFRLSCGGQLCRGADRRSLSPGGRCVEAERHTPTLTSGINSMPPGRSSIHCPSFYFRACCCGPDCMLGVLLS